MKKLLFLISFLICITFVSKYLAQEKKSDDKELEKKIEALIKKLDSQDWEERDEAKTQILEFKAKAVPYLKKAKESTTDHDLKVKIGEILKELGVEEVTSENIKEKAQELIDKLSKEEFVFYYEWSYNDEPTCYVYRLGGSEKVLDYEESIEYLKNYTKSDNVILRRNLAYFLHYTKSKKAVPFLKELLKDPDDFVIVFALYSLIKLNDDSYKKDLLTLMNSQSKNIKKMAVKAVEKAPAKESVEMLIPLLEDTNKEVRFNAFYSFYKITDVSFNYNAYTSEKKRAESIKKIKQWWGENKDKIDFKKKSK